MFDGGETDPGSAAAILGRFRELRQQLTDVHWGGSLGRLVDDVE
jgi:hypothetical protein